MKKGILLLLSIVLFITSCESDNNSDTTLLEADLLGTWNLKEQTLDGNMVFTKNGITSKATVVGYAKNIDMSLTFNNNPKKVVSEGKYTLVTTSTFLGQTLVEEQVVESENDPAENPNWELNGNNITLSNDISLPSNLIVESFNGKTLTLKAEIDENISDKGDSIVIKTTIYFVLEK